MLSSITWKQFREWLAFYELEHLGWNPEDRADWRMATSTAILANHWREKKPLKPEELMPKFGPPPEQSPDALYRALTQRADADAKRTARNAVNPLKQGTPDGNNNPAEPPNRPRAKQARAGQRTEGREGRSSGAGEEREISDGSVRETP